MDKHFSGYPCDTLFRLVIFQKSIKLIQLLCKILIKLRIITINKNVVLLWLNYVKENISKNVITFRVKNIYLKKSPCIFIYYEYVYYHVPNYIIFYGALDI